MNNARDSEIHFPIFIRPKEATLIMMTSSLSQLATKFSSRQYSSSALTLHNARVKKYYKDYLLLNQLA